MAEVEQNKIDSVPGSASLGSDQEGQQTYQLGKYEVVVGTTESASPDAAADAEAVQERAWKATEVMEGIEEVFIGHEFSGEGEPEWNSDSICLSIPDYVAMSAIFKVPEQLIIVDQTEFFIVIRMSWLARSEDNEE